MSEHEFAVPIEASEWFTPKGVFDALGIDEFDLDPAHPGRSNPHCVVPARRIFTAMIAALTKIVFEINPGGCSAYAEFSVLFGDNMGFNIQMVTDNGARVILRRVTRDQILSAARALEHEVEAV